jgi:hypothetical protein
VASATGISGSLVECEYEVKLSDAGFFRFDARPVDARGERPCDIRVYEGAAAVALLTGNNALRGGQAMMCSRRCGDRAPTTEFSPSELDGFDQWARRTYEILRR